MNGPKLREVYRPSGRVDPVRFPIAVAILFLLVAGMAWMGSRALSGTDPRGMVVPLILTLPLAALSGLAISKGRCRNPTIATMVGSLAGLLVVVGPHWLNAIGLEGWSAALRPDRALSLMKSEIHWRMFTLLARRLSLEQAISLTDWLSWIGVFVCLALAPLAPAWASRFVSKRLYGEKSGQWMSSMLLIGSADIMEAIRRTLPTGSLATLSDQLRSPPPVGKTHGYLTLHYVPGFAALESGDAAYLTVKGTEPAAKEPGPSRNATPDDPWQAPASVSLAGPLIKDIGEPWKLEPEEAELIAAHFPGLRDPFGYPASTQWPDVQPKTAPVEVENVDGGEPIAEIVAVPEPYARSVLDAIPRGITKKWWMIAVLLLVATCVASALLMPMVSPRWAYPLTMLVDFAIALTLILTWVMFRRSLYGRALRRVAAREFGKRTDRWIDPDNSSALFIRVVPRAFWDICLPGQAASLISVIYGEIGFLLIDSANGQLLYEGDHERWRIPYSSIVSCELETVVENPQSGNGNHFHFVALRARLLDGTLWEAPLEEIPTRLKPHKNQHRQHAAEALRSAILAAVSLKAESVSARSATS